MRDRSRPLARFGTAVILLSIVLLLQLGAAGGLINTFLLPSPLQIAASYPALIWKEGLFYRLVITATEVFVATGIAIAVGGLLGWGLYRSSNAWAAFSGWLVGFNAAPLIMLYPLFLVFFGRGPITVIVLGVLGALPVIAIKMRDAFTTVPKVLLDVGASFNLTRRRQFRLIHLPAATPTIVAGVRLGCFYALTSVIGAEFLTGIGGLGALIPDLADRFKLGAMYGAIVFIVITSATFVAAVNRTARWLRPA